MSHAPPRARTARSTLRVHHAVLWQQIGKVIDLDAWTEASEDDSTRLVIAGRERRFVREVLPTLQAAGLVVLQRAARTATRLPDAPIAEDLADQLQGLRQDVLTVLHQAQRHADGHVVWGLHAWDPVHQAGSVRALVGAGLMMPWTPHDAAPEAAEPMPYGGTYRLHPDLPPPPAVAYDLHDAVMEAPDDLDQPAIGPVAVLHDVAALAAAIARVGARRTHKDDLHKGDAKKLGRQLGDATLAKHGVLTAVPRWARALTALELLRGVSTHPIERTVLLDDGLEDTLQGETADVIDRLMHRVVDRSLHGLVPALKAALATAGDGALDEVVFLELLSEQHRDIAFQPWERHGVLVYPSPSDDHLLPFDEDGWDRLEHDLIAAALRRLNTYGVLRRAPGVFAATEDGRLWAGIPRHAPPPVWVSSDLEVTVPPGSITPWERFQIERLGRCVARDTVDRFVLEREALHRWLAHHDVQEAIDLLARRCPALPQPVIDTLTGWADSAQQIVLTHGVVV